LKFDGVMGDRENEATRRFAKLWQVRSTDVVWVAGSTQAPEEQIVLDVFAKLAPQYPQLRCIIVPRHPERFNQVAALVGETGLPWIRRSELPEQGAFSRLLLVDTVGELRYWWGLADVAFVGGSFGTRGGQNMLEPAAYGAAVCFGPHTFNFRDVVRLLLSHHAAVVVRSPGELEQFVRLAIDSPPWRYQLGERARQLVRAQQGATQATLEFLQQRIDRLKPAQSEAA
jgi:3-deoxy-D-manno-octulosonic-acid transferase